jgi:hypothetical protein
MASGSSMDGAIASCRTTDAAPVFITNQKVFGVKGHAADVFLSILALSGFC